jgi:hypothetical protein
VLHVRRVSLDADARARRLERDVQVAPARASDDRPTDHGDAALGYVYR